MTSHFSSGGCSVDLPGGWKLLPAEQDDGGRWNVERYDGSQVISVYPLRIPKPAPPQEWRLGLGALINLRRENDREGFGSDARFSEPEYRTDEAGHSASYTVYDPEERVLLATLIKMVPSRWCVASLREDGTDPAGFATRANALLGAIHVEP